MGDPLAIARLGRVANTTTVNIGKAGCEAGVPPAPAFGVTPGYVANIFDVGAEAGGADHGAVGAVQAAASDVVPAGIFEVIEQELAESIGIDAAALAGSCRLDGGADLAPLRFCCWSGREFEQYLGAANGARFGEEPVVAIDVHFRERDVGRATADSGAGAHGMAETGGRGFGALHRDEKRGMAALPIDAVRVGAIEEYLVLDGDGG